MSSCVQQTKGREEIKQRVYLHRLTLSRAFVCTTCFLTSKHRTTSQNGRDYRPPVLCPYNFSWSLRSVFFAAIREKDVFERVWHKCSAASREAPGTVQAARGLHRQVWQWSQWNRAVWKVLVHGNSRKFLERLRGTVCVHPCQGFHSQVYGQQPGWFWLRIAGSYSTLQ